MRGTQGSGRDRTVAHGIIPAYAGNTSSCTSCCSRCGDHPRVCGEHSYGDWVSRRVKGSSPRMRGTHRSRQEHSRQPGIIPAYAGNTFCNHDQPRVVSDHPRVCGEHDCLNSLPVLRRGSSPRLRGTQFEVAGVEVPAGIIPAYAGNTRFWQCARMRSRDHPRVCGEHSYLG